MKFNKNIFFIISIIICTCHLARSKEFGTSLIVSSELTKDVTNRTIKFLKDASIPGYSISGMNTDDIKQQLSKINVILNRDGVYIGSGNALRTGGLTYRNLIIFNELIKPRVENSEYEDEFLFHEVLRALGYNDENYEITLLFNLVKSRKMLNISPELFQDISQNFSVVREFDNSQYLYAMGGSGTSVGSGGDDVALSAKIRVMHLLVVTGGSPEEIAKLIKMPFEAQITDTKSRKVKIYERQNGKAVIIPGVYYLICNEQERIDLIVRTLLKILEF